MNTNRKRAFDHGNDTLVQSAERDAVAEAWSPESLLKVTSLEDSNLRGGNFVLDCDGNATTLSFAFEKDGALYGLTAGHLAEIGDPIFVFLLSSKTPNDFDDGESYEMMEVGEVVSKNIETDSLIFDISNPYMIGKVDPLKLLPGLGLADHALRLPEPNANPAPPPVDTKVLLCGAMRRGEFGIVAITGKIHAGAVSKKGDIGIWSGNDGASHGDCGAIYMTEDGLGLAMHHCVRGEKAPYCSFGTPLASILFKHALLGGDDVGGDDAPESQQIIKSQRDKHPERRNMAKFQTKITKAVPPVGGALMDDVDRHESRNIAHFEDAPINSKVAPCSESSTESAHEAVPNRN